MASHKQLLLSNFLPAFIFIFVVSFVVETVLSGTVGVNYGRLADNLPPPLQVVQLLQSQGVARVKIFDTDAAVLSALGGSGISVTVAIPNEQLSSAAADQSFTDVWVQSNILPYHPNTIIDAVAVGNEVFADSANTAFLVPAMKNLYASLVKYGVASTIKVSSPVAMGALQSSYPPSSGSFEPDLVEPVMKPMLEFLQQTGSFFMANVYPFFAYIGNTDTISLDYALLRDNGGNVDGNNGLVYKSLFDAQLDAVYAAITALGFPEMKVVVGETGWPSIGDEGEVGASVENAAAYNGNLVRRVLTGGGTPLRPDVPIDVYLFALFNENQKPGPTSERNYGLFYPNEEKVYDIPLTAAALGVASSNSKVAAAAPAHRHRHHSGETWCVANEKAGAEKLQAALDYACGEGGADCRPIQPGATCHDPDTIRAHASFAFNSYYQKNARRSGSCYFGGAAYVVTQPPKFGTCDFAIRD